MSSVNTIAQELIPVGMEPNGKEADLLNREAFVEQMFDLVELLSRRKKNACFALNGRWGVGKTFVLNLFEEKVSQFYQSDSVLSCFLLFRYNCWEFDYYEEPLVAIVSSMMEEIEKQTSLISKEKKEKLKWILKEVREICERSATSLLEKKLGFEPGEIQSVIDIIKTGVAEGYNQAKKAKEYDENIGFTKALKLLRKEIEDLAQEQTVIFIVDELDRCLPEYTIKVLERLHHLFDGISNVQVIFSVDTMQLEHIVKQVFGIDTEAKKYLQKFIQFEMKLDEGDFSTRFSERFPNYCSYFTKDSELFVEDVSQFQDMILQGIDMRRRIELTERCFLLHMLLNDTSEEEGVYSRQSDAAYLCLELFLAVLYDSRLKIERARNNFNFAQVFDPQCFGTDLPKGLTAMSEKYCSTDSPTYHAESSEKTYIDVSTLLGSLLRVYRNILGFDDRMLNSTDDRELFINFGSDFWRLLETVS